MAGAVKRTRKLKGNIATYRDLLKLDIPKQRRTRVAGTDIDKLYPIQIMETSQDQCRVKVHYIGYATRYDEWKDIAEVEDIAPTTTATRSTESLESCHSEEQLPTEVYRPYSFHDNLRIQVKKSLICSRIRSPKIKIKVPIDILMFNGGLKVAGYPKSRVSGVECSTIGFTTTEI